MGKALVVSVVLLVSGCEAYTKAIYGDGPAFADYTQCFKDNQGYAQIPDFGVTYRQHMTKCMREAGWERLPGQQPEGPAAYRRAANQ